MPTSMLWAQWSIACSEILVLVRSGRFVPSSARKMPSMATPRVSGAVTSMFRSTTENGMEAVARFSGARSSMERGKRWCPGENPVTHKHLGGAGRRGERVHSRRPEAILNRFADMQLLPGFAARYRNANVNAVVRHFAHRQFPDMNRRARGHRYRQGGIRSMTAGPVSMLVIPICCWRILAGQLGQYPLLLRGLRLDFHRILTRGETGHGELAIAIGNRGRAEGLKPASHRTHA